MHLTLHFVMTSVALLATMCHPPAEEPQISREQAIEISREQVSFEPESIEAVRTTTDDQVIWRVTFRGRLPGQPPELSELVVVEVDAESGAIVSVART